MNTLRGILLLASTFALGCNNANVNNADAGVDMAASPDLQVNPVDRGRYIMNNVGLCTFCHTPLNADGTRDMTRLFAGWDCLVDLTPNDPTTGCLSSANLTPDPTTGLGMWTDAQIMNAFRNGMDNQGMPLAPVMPYWAFHNMMDADAMAIVAYLRTLTPVSHKVTAKQPPWTTIPAATPIDPNAIPMPAANAPNHDSAVRGRYLASMIGLCVDCHSPMAAMNAPTPIDTTKLFSGGRIFTAAQLGLMSPPYPMMITTTNLTQDATGLLGWTAADVLKAFKMGLDRNNKAVCASTHGSTTSSYAGLTDRDAMDIANYVVTLPPIVDNTGPTCGGPTN